MPNDDDFVDVYYCIPGLASGTYASGSIRIKFKGIGLWVISALENGGMPILITDVKLIK